MSSIPVRKGTGAPIKRRSSSNKDQGVYENKILYLSGYKTGFLSL